jgi:dTDP-4-amino-4,6-dideoxygalactose transaminase
MTVPFVDLSAQYRSIRGEIDAAIAAVIADAAYIGNLSNKYVQRFESDFAAFVGTAHCVACANGTDAIEILLKACGIGPGDDVIVPAFSWIATSEAASNIGARPVFVDIDPRTYTIDPAQIEAALTPRTRAIVPVHLYGLAADMDPILEIAARHNLMVIEDCAQAHGARYKGRAVGTMGHAGSFSFFPGKNLGAYGDAGGMVTSDAGISERARMISQHGQAKAKHDHRIEGRNSRLDGLQAAILSAKLPYLADWTEARRRHAARYDDLLRESDFQRQHVPSDRRHVYHLYTVRVANRDLVQANLGEAGISTAVQYPRALPMLSAYADRGYSADQFPAAVALADTTLSLPMYPELTTEAIDRVAATLLDVAGVRRAC